MSHPTHAPVHFSDDAGSAAAHHVLDLGQRRHRRVDGHRHRERTVRNVVREPPLVGLDVGSYERLLGGRQLKS